MSLPARVLVLGLARSGRAAAAALSKRGVTVTAADRRLGNDEDPAALDGVELVVKSPGVPGENALVRAARAREIPVWSEVELGYRLLPDARFVGVTGTNGKTTTVELLGAIFRAAGRDVAVAGNVGRPLTTSVELEPSGSSASSRRSSSRTCTTWRARSPSCSTSSPTISTATTRSTRTGPRSSASSSEPGRRSCHGAAGSTGLTFAADDPLPAEPRIPGAHNRENAAAATVAARAAGIEDGAIAEALRTFPGVEHRLELVAELGGVRYVNDSKATNVAAATRGLAAYDEPLHVILGGSLKGEDFSTLVPALGSNVRGIYLIGRPQERSTPRSSARAIPLERSGDLATAVAARAANASKGDIVLLSPACASFDQFRDFEHRGEEYRRLVQNLEG